MTDPRAYQQRSAYRGLAGDDTARHLFIFSQSDIKAVEICPERGRRQLLRLHPRTYTDSTATGEAFHLAVELCCQSIIDGQGPLALTDMWDVAVEELRELMALDGSRWVKIKQVDTLDVYLWRMLQTFYDDVLPSLSPQAVELHLGPTTIYEDDQRVIQLEGTADYDDHFDGLADWKTSSREWVEWEHKRWDVQPTVYTWLLHGANGACSERQFTWHVFQTNGNYQRIETTRGPQDWAWLKERVLGLALQMEANLPVWFKNDTSALCSAKYCDAWDVCKGIHFVPQSSEWKP